MPDNKVQAYDGGQKKNSRQTKDEDLQPEIDDDIAEGPIFQRSCTDILCCPLFVAFCAGMAWAFIYGLANGDPEKLITLYDYDANGCGKTSGVKDFDFIYWPYLDYATNSHQTVCVKFCPTIANPLTASDCFTNSIITSCTNSSFDMYDSKKYANKFCIPDEDSPNNNGTYNSFVDQVLGDYNGEWVTHYIADLTYCWWVCIVCALVAFVGGMLYMVFIR